MLVPIVARLANLHKKRLKELLGVSFLPPRWAELVDLSMGGFQVV